MPDLNLVETIQKYKTFMVTSPGCPFCTEAMKILEKHNIKYHVFEHNKYLNLSSEISRKYNHKTYPKIFIDSEFIGGCDDLKKIFAK